MPFYAKFLKVILSNKGKFHAHAIVLSQKNTLLLCQITSLASYQILASFWYYVLLVMLLLAKPCVILGLL